MNSQITKVDNEIITINGLKYVVVKVTQYGNSTYLVRFGREYVGKTSDGGYKSKSAAVRYIHNSR